MSFIIFLFIMKVSLDHFTLICMVYFIFKKNTYFYWFISFKSFDPHSKGITYNFSMLYNIGTTTSLWQSIEDINPPTFDDRYSFSTSNDDSDDEGSHSSNNHYSKNVDTPLDSLVSRPLWSHKTLDWIVDWTSDPFDARRTRS